MEVHHPHHPTHKKKWSEYLVEFFMLFTAVTLGFFAENVREHQIEKHREISYLKNVHEVNVSCCRLIIQKIKQNGFLLI